MTALVRAVMHFRGADQNAGKILASLFGATLAGMLMLGCEQTDSLMSPIPPATIIGKALSTTTPSLPTLGDRSYAPQLPTTPASSISTPSARASAVASATPTGIEIKESTVSFETYPFERYLEQRQDPTNGFLFNALDSPVGEQIVSMQPVANRAIRAIVIENEFLSLVFLPELGGRLFQITFKPTNQSLLYNNRVLKPTSWGPANQGGWLAAGGMEWAFPVNEHGYEWGSPWLVQARQGSGGGTLTIMDSKNNSDIRVTIDITLPVNGAFIIVHPRIENISSRPIPIQFWINAQVALGKQRTVSPGTEFVLPAQSVYVHSNGNQFIPNIYVPREGASSPATPMPWGVIAGHDLRVYQNWDNYLGIFATKPTGPYVGAYDHDSQIGIVRIFPPDQTPGVKLFAFGQNYCCRSQFADDGSDYFELWGGLPRTFFPSDDVVLASGETRQWDEIWLPFVRIGGLSAAADDAVLSMSSHGGVISVGAYSAILRQATLVLSKEGKELKRWQMTLSPKDPYVGNIVGQAGNLSLELLDRDGRPIVATSQ